METTDKQIGKNVTRIRNDQGLSQKEVGDRMKALGWKWAQNTVWAVESGERSLKLAEAEDLANIFSVNTWVLTRGDEDFEAIRTAYEAQEALELAFQAADRFTALKKLVAKRAKGPLSDEMKDLFYEVLHATVIIEQGGVPRR